MERKQSFMTEWAIVDGAKANNRELLTTTPEKAYTFLTTDESVDLALFGKVKNDYRANEVTTEFTDGHRIITSPLCRASCDGIITRNTHYTLGEINPLYAEWCEKNNHDIFAALEEGRKYSFVLLSEK
jgi:hypothetical protein